MSIIDRLKAIKRYYSAKRILSADVKRYSKYCCTSKYCREKGFTAARDILVYCHVVEKGLSHKTIKPKFGYNRVKLIVDSLEKYMQCGGDDSFIIGLAESTLKLYMDINISLGVNPKDLSEIVVNIEQMKSVFDVGAVSLSCEQYFVNSSSSFTDFSSSRHSIRLYDFKSETITIDEIISCIKTAQNCPSACNRQAVRIKVITDESLIKSVCDIQGGSNGFGENSGALLLITSDISLYGPDERRLPMLDCGLFIMNLVYAFHENRIGSCILNGSFTEQREKQIRDIVPIPNNEMCAAVISLSKIPSNECIKIAKSVKRDIGDIINIM